MSSADRDEIYDRLAEASRDTPFVELTGIGMPAGCRLWAKEEYRNPTGSHYDREMWRFLQELENSGDIVPGKTKMLETTTGNSGASFAWMCRVLGYPAPTIVIPEDMPPARIAQIESYGAEVVRSPSGDYITGVSATFGAIYPLYDQQGYYAPQHWNDEYHCVAGMEELGHEILDNARAAGVNFDYFMLALGNGGSARGVGKVLHDAGVKVIGVEPAESPIVSEYQKNKKKRRWESSKVHKAHNMIGTGPFLPKEVYPNMRHAVEEGYIEPQIMHPSSANAAATQLELMDACSQHVGMSSAACVWSARELAAIGRKRGKALCVGVILYDPAWKYL